MFFVKHLATLISYPIGGVMKLTVCRYALGQQIWCWGKFFSFNGLTKLTFKWIWCGSYRRPRPLREFYPGVRRPILCH